jgi:hypothetical protein
MRIIIVGDRFWDCDRLAESIFRRLVARYGPDIVIGLGGAPGVDHAFSTACRNLGIAIDLYLADFSHLGDYRFNNCQLLRSGAELCIIVHHAPLDDGSKDLARQAILAGIATYLIESENGKPTHLNECDEILR